MYVQMHTMRFVSLNMPKQPLEVFPKAAVNSNCRLLNPLE